MISPLLVPLSVFEWREQKVNVRSMIVSRWEFVRLEQPNFDVMNGGQNVLKRTRVEATAMYWQTGEHCENPEKRGSKRSTGAFACLIQSKKILTRCSRQFCTLFFFFGNRIPVARPVSGWRSSKISAIVGYPQGRGAVDGEKKTEQPECEVVVVVFGLSGRTSKRNQQITHSDPVWANDRSASPTLILTIAIPPSSSRLVSTGRKVFNVNLEICENNGIIGGGEVRGADTGGFRRIQGDASCWGLIGHLS